MLILTWNAGELLNDDNEQSSLQPKSLLYNVVDADGSFKSDQDNNSSKISVNGHPTTRCHIVKTSDLTVTDKKASNKDLSTVKHNQCMLYTVLWHHVST